MTDNELLLAMSDMLDKKLKPVNDRLKKIELTQENDILPRLQTDIDVMKKVIAEHSEKLQKIS